MRPSAYRNIAGIMRWKLISVWFRGVSSIVCSQETHSSYVIVNAPYVGPQLPGVAQRRDGHRTYAIGHTGQQPTNTLNGACEVEPANRRDHLRWTLQMISRVRVYPRDRSNRPRRTDQRLARIKVIDEIKPKHLGLNPLLG